MKAAKMNKERLQEIKDSIDLQLTVSKSIGVRNEIAEEEKELYDEVIRLNNIINELSNFIIKVYKKEMDKTSDWWLQEELCTSFDDINLATNFRLEEELKENNNE